ncbi:MAG: glycosyltransferase [Bacteroidales bacterium]|nr:glycosyltransferase [Bacteroidales bacterium]
MKHKLSIVIPVYNGEKLLTRCLDSVLSGNPLDESFEVVVVDDFSTDRTADIIKEYKAKYPQVVSLRQSKNSRQGAARNLGIDVATGEWIMFLDADDMLCWDGIARALVSVKGADCDLCFYDFEYQQPDGKWSVYHTPRPEGYCMMPSKEYLETYYTPWYNAPWRNIYRTDFLRRVGTRFEEGIRWEDCDWTVKVYAASDNVKFVDGVGYKYCYNEAATSKQDDLLAVAEKIYAGYRLLTLSHSCKSDLPNLAVTIGDEGKYRYVSENIRFRKLTKFRIAECVSIYRHVDRLFDRHSLVDHFTWSAWEKLVLNHKVLALFALSLARPVTVTGRKLAQISRAI